MFICVLLMLLMGLVILEMCNELSKSDSSVLIWFLIRLAQGFGVF